MMRIKKKTAFGIAIGTVILVIIATGVYLAASREETRVSESKRLSVERVFDGMRVKNGTTLQGKYDGSDDVKLYYLASSEDKHVIGSDAITLESDKTFIANLTLNTANYKDQGGEVKIYAQNDQGQVQDVVNVKVEIE